MPSKRMTKIEQLLNEVEALVEGHFVLKSRKHSGLYFNKDAAFPQEGIIELICQEFAERFANLQIDFVVAPAVGGVAYAFDIIHYLPMVQRAYADKDGDGFIIRRGFEKKLRGMRVLVLEDVTTTGDTTRGVIHAIQTVGGTVVAVGVLCNRGNVTAENLGVPWLETLFNLPVESWTADECPLCMAGVQINTNLGHGAEFVAKRMNPTS